MALTDITTAVGGDVAALKGPRRRGKSKAPNFTYKGPVSVIALELDADDAMRHRLENHWESVFRLRRALQRDAADRCRAYWAARHERKRDPAKLRQRLGLTKKGMEAAAQHHIEASGWMGDHLSKATGLHTADEVWETVDRHLFADASGRRHGPPRIGAGRDFGCIHGRARSHTKNNTWETYRLVGSLDSHLQAFRHPGLAASITSAADTAHQACGVSILAQPARLPTPARPARGSWWDYDGALAVVFTGLAGGDLVLPVRVAQGASQWAHLRHFLADPSVWHKIDLVRVADRRATGGWRYYAYLLTHQSGYQSVSTKTRRAGIPAGRRAGVDANVSNISLASFPADTPARLMTTQVICTPEQQKTAHRAAVKTRARQRALDRSRRNTNRDQYHPSVRQTARAERRCVVGLSEKQISDPGGARHCHAGGVPQRAYRHDTLSNSYRTTRAAHRQDARKTSRAKRSRATDIAGRIVATHGNTVTIEDCQISTWARLWGKRIALFSPGMLVAALKAECTATGGHLYRARTRTTALSQHCLCGERVNKTLDQRTHHCPHCGLRGDRDVVSAILAACVELTDPDDPRTAKVDYTLAHALQAWLPPQQEWGGSVNRHQPPTPPGSDPAPPDGTGPARTGSHHPVASAEHAALGPPPNRPGHVPGRRGNSRKRQPPKLPGAA